MKDIKDATFVESLVAFRDMTAFVCQNREDQNLFSNQVCENYVLLGPHQKFVIMITQFCTHLNQLKH